MSTCGSQKLEPIRSVSIEAKGHRRSICGWQVFELNGIGSKRHALCCGMQYEDALDTVLQCTLSPTTVTGTCAACRHSGRRTLKAARDDALACDLWHD